jgi:membrane protein YqaA with SNARE-associated domain
VGLFTLAFLAATILPAQSEAALVGALLTGSYPWWALVVVASVGNVGGSVVNWLLGRSVERFRNQRWFPVSAAALDRAQDRYRRYGRWSLLLSWVPFIGDPLTVVAGCLREPLGSFVLIVAVAKTARYLAVAGFATGWMY